MHSQVEIPILQSTFGLDSHVAVVTGASSGLGAHFARVLHAAGATVVLVARRADRLKALAHDLGNRSLFITADICSADARTEIVARTLDELGRIDILVNNAGISHPGQPRATEESMDEFARVLDINVSKPDPCAGGPMGKQRYPRELPGAGIFPDRDEHRTVRERSRDEVAASHVPDRPSGCARRARRRLAVPLRTDVDILHRPGHRRRRRVDSRVDPVTELSSS